MAVSGVVTALPMFWALPTSFLGGAAAAAGIALVNCTGNLARIFQPGDDRLYGWNLYRHFEFRAIAGFRMPGSVGRRVLILALVPAEVVNG